MEIGYIPIISARYITSTEYCTKYIGVRKSGTEKKEGEQKSERERETPSGFFFLLFSCYSRSRSIPHSVYVSFRGFSCTYCHETLRCFIFAQFSVINVVMPVLRFLRGAKEKNACNGPVSDCVLFFSSFLSSLLLLSLLFTRVLYSTLDIDTAFIRYIE